MFNFVFLGVGKVAPPLDEMVAEYVARIGRFGKAAHEFIRGEHFTPGGRWTPERLLEKEGQTLLGRVGDKSRMVVVDERGEQMSSARFIPFLESFFGSPPVYFVVGGPFGLAEEVKKRGDRRLSLSPMTLPHDVALVVLLEQIFRALKGRSNQGYAK